MKTAREYQLEIATWASYNFSYIDRTGLGMAEEVGEYAHALLKSLQGIRGQQGGNTIGLNEALLDAIGDCMVYALHYAEVNNTFISFDTALEYASVNKGQNEVEILGLLYTTIGVLLYNSKHIQSTTEGKEPGQVRTEIQRLFGNLCLLCEIRGFGDPIKDVFLPTWREVRKRDWIKYPTNGKTN